MHTLRRLIVPLVLLLVAASACVLPSQHKFEPGAALFALSNLLSRESSFEQSFKSKIAERQEHPRLPVNSLVDVLAVLASGTRNNETLEFVEAKSDIIDDGNATAILIPRQNEEDGENGCDAFCSRRTCGSGVCPISRRLKRSIFEFERADWEGSPDMLDQLNRTHAFQKRAFPAVNPQDPTSVENYLNARENTNGAVDLFGRTNGEDEWSFTRTERFRDFQSNPLIINSGLLTGCTVVAVVTRTAVYMGHFWQGLGWETHKGQPRHNFQQNIANLITGDTPLYKASGTSLDPAIFRAEEVTDSEGNQVTVQPVAVIMTPSRATAGKPLYYPSNVGNLARILRERTGVMPIIKKYNPIRSDRDLDNSPRRGQALFEFEWDADGQGNGNWRLWTEYSHESGGGALVQGRNRPT